MPSLLEFNPFKPLFQAGAHQKKAAAWIFTLLASINLAS